MFFVFRHIDMPYLSEFNQPYDLSGIIERTTTVLGTAGSRTRRFTIMSSNSVSLPRGNNRMIRVFIKDINGDIINLNGAEGRFFVATSSKATSYLLRKTTTDYTEGTVRTPEKGEVIFFLKPEDTENLHTSQYFYQVLIILKNGERHTVCSDVLNIKPNLEYGEIEEPENTLTDSVDIPNGASSAFVVLDPNRVIFPVLSSPSATTDNIAISNVVYSQTGATVYLTASTTEEGWKIDYFTLATA